jgi:Rieske Fe-S protein
MDRAVRALLRLYPRPWRDRYAAEVEALLAARGVRAGDLLDLARAALDARVAPQRLLLAAPLAERLAARSTGPPAATSRVEPPPYGEMPGVGVGSVTRRAFMRRMLGAGVGLVSLEFIGGTLAFLWPNVTEGVGAEFRVGTIAEILAANPSWAQGWPVDLPLARVFLVNAAAARELALGRDVSVREPAPDEILALWRKCPHLGCMVPALCPDRKRFQCNCHQSTYNILGEKMAKGPASRGMDRFAVRIGVDGVLVIDSSEVIRGSPAGQVSYRDQFPQDEGCQ